MGRFTSDYLSLMSFPLLPSLRNLLLSFLFLGCPVTDADGEAVFLGAATAGVSPDPPVYSYRIINSYPHDRGAFTQGLVFDNGFLYEGTGIYGQSSLRKVSLETGRVIKVYYLPPNFFGEGITVFKDRIIQLTWRSQVGFVYDKKSFELLQTFHYSGEGWGITHDTRYLIMSKGTAVLSFLDPQTFKEINRIEVRDQHGPVTRLNELEYVEGEIYANVWPTERIVRIIPATGQVTGWIDLKGLLQKGEDKALVDVLNGIAYDAHTRRLFVTGKLWPRLFVIEVTCY